MNIKSLMKGAAFLGAWALASTGASADGLPGAAYVSYKDGPVPVYSWSGIYGGVHAGYLSGTADYKYTAGGALSVDFDGGVVGGQLGVQHQFWNNFVLGAEFSYTGAGTTSGEKTCPNPSLTCTAHPKDIIEVVGRLGYAWGNMMPYIKGGYANVSLNSGAYPGNVGNDSQRHNGFVIGGGVEYSPFKNIVLGVDYSHIEFDAETYSAGSFGNERKVDGDINVIKGRVSFMLSDLPASLK